MAVCLNPPGDCGDEGDKAILRPEFWRQERVSWPALATGGPKWPRSSLLLWLQQRLLPAPLPAAPCPPTPQSPSWLQGPGRRPHRFATSEQEGGGAGRGTEGWSYPDQQELARSTGPLVRLQPSMAESRSQQPPGKGAGPRSDLSHTHSQNAFTWVCSIDIPWCCASSANFRGSRCLFYSS